VFKGGNIFWDSVKSGNVESERTDGNGSVGVRSLNFVDTLLTIGTGAGAIYFFDRRANKYLEMNCSHPCSLNVGAGWLVCCICFMFSLSSVNVLALRDQLITQAISNFHLVSC